MILDIIAIYLNNGDGTFSNPTTYITDHRPYRVRVADMDNDSKFDIIVAHRSGNISILFNNGNGAFIHQMIYSSDIVPRAFNVADMNNDGHIDIIYADFSKNYYVLFNRGNLLIC